MAKDISTLEDSEEDGDSLVALVTGSVLRDTKKSFMTYKKPKLIDGKQYGYLTLDKDHRKGGRYKCECVCGAEVFLDRREILARARLKAGCLNYRCTFGAFEVKAWASAEFALDMQLAVLLKTAPESVDPDWGGSAYEGRRGVSTEDGREKFIEDVWPMVNKARHEWWLARKNPVLPYSWFNLYMQDAPSFDVFEGGAKYIMFRRRLYSFSEVAETFEVDIEDVRRWRKDIVDDNKLAEKIMEASAI